MRFFYVQGRRYAQFQRLGQQPGLTHAFSTRPMNMAPRDGPDAETYADNRRLMATDLGFDPRWLCFCQQVHDSRLAVVDGSTAFGMLAHCDGVVTALPMVPLMTFSADCPLVLVFDPVRRVLGLVHASWRCTVARLTGRLLELMVSRFGCSAQALWAGIGPGAGPCCYEVQDDVYEAADALADRDKLFRRRDGRTFFDLWQANRGQLIEAGVAPEHIELAGLCTVCCNDKFFSYRREGPGCGHFALLAGLSTP